MRGVRGSLGESRGSLGELKGGPCWLGSFFVAMAVAAAAHRLSQSFKC